MGNLLDTLRTNSQQATQAQGTTDETGKLSTLLRAKSGKAVGGADTLQSNLAEQSAVAGTNQQLGALNAQANVQNQGVAQQQAGAQTQANAQDQSLDQSRKFNDLQTNMKTNQILADLERGKGTIDAKDQAAQVEIAAQNLRLGNQQYIDSLNRAADEARLGDANNFEQEMSRTVFGDNLGILQKNNQNQSVLKQNDRDFQKTLVQMGLDDSYAMMKNGMAAQNQQAQIGAVGSAVTTGIGAYNTYQNQTKTAPVENSGNAPTSTMADNTAVGGVSS